MYIADSENARIRRVAPDGIISTVAGSGERGFSGDGGPATEAALHRPSGLAVDSDGTLYIADSLNHRIRKVDPGGAITTVAGNGTQGRGGDGGPAVAAQLGHPRDVAIGPNGEIYIADSNNFRVRLVDGDGMISTFVGAPFSVATVVVEGFGLPSAVVLDSDANLYIALAAPGRVFVVRLSDLSVQTIAGTGDRGFSGDGGPATEAMLNQPQGLAVQGDVVYIADSANNSIRSVAEGTIQTIAGRLHLSGDGGPATDATLDGPRGIALDSDGNLYIADGNNDAVRRVTPQGVISTVAGTGARDFRGDGRPATEAQLFSPKDVLVGSNDALFISQFRRVRRVGPDGVIQTVAGNGFTDQGEDDVPATEAGLSIPAGLAMDEDGNLFVADSAADRVRRITTEGTIGTAAGTGQGGFSGDGGPADQAHLDGPEYLAIDQEQRLYISDSANGRVRRIGVDGTIETVIGGGDQPLSDGVPALEARIFFTDGLTFDQDGNLIVAFSSRSQIYRLEPDGTLTAIAGMRNRFGGDGGPAREANLSFPEGLASDDEGHIYVADGGNDRIRKLTPVITRINEGGVVNAGSSGFTVNVDTVAPDSIASIFGIGLSLVAESATSLPLPTELGGVTIDITDNTGATHQAQFFAVTPNQINCLIPADTALGPATLTVHNGNGAASTTEIEVVAVAPGLFSLAGTGEGVAAATAFRRDAKGVDTPLAVFDTSQVPFQAVPIDLGSETDLVVLSLFGTGILNSQVSITATIGGEPGEVFAFARAGFEGLDQINLGIPRSLIGRGVVEVRVTVDGIPLNVVTITIL